MELGHILFTAFNAVFPVVAVILVGFVLRRIGMLTKEFLNVGNKFVFHVCLSCMLFVNVYGIDGVQNLPWDVILFCVAVVLVIFCLGLVTALATTKLGERRGVLLQCTFRSNMAIIGLSLTAVIGGEEAQGIAAIVTAFTVPVFNILAVISLSVFNSDGKKVSPLKILKGIAKNPLIIGVVAGLAALVVRELQLLAFDRVVFSVQRDLPFLYAAANQLKSVATPLALIVLGGQFELSAVKGLYKEILVGSLWRLVIAPLIGIGSAVVLSACTNLINFGPNEYPALIALFGSPVAVSSAVMAKQMGSDEQLATQYVMWTSLCSVVTIFLTVCILMGVGLLRV